MDFGLGLLTFGTLGFVAVFAYLNIRAVEKRPGTHQQKSSLSSDGISERMAAAKIGR